jgi:hypothetical protein
MRQRAADADHADEHDADDRHDDHRDAHEHHPDDPDQHEHHADDADQHDDHPCNYAHHPGYYFHGDGRRRRRSRQRQLERRLEHRRQRELKVNYAQTIAGRYRIEGRLGVGGMSTVYLAFDDRLERNVAIKLLAEHLADDATFVSRFRREALSAARLPTSSRCSTSASTSASISTSS